MKITIAIPRKLRIPKLLPVKDASNGNGPLEAVKTQTLVLFKQTNHHLLLALTLAFTYHGVLLLSGTFKKTYDALIHIFFADHYNRAWFDPWEYRWYTGFTLTSYPPGSQQSIALASHLFGGSLLDGFVMVQLFAITWVTFGMYRFACVWVSEEAAGYASLLIVFSSCITETVHVFGQLPTTFSLGFLLHALPYVKRWLQEGRARYLLLAWSFNAATTAGHHVTTLFGALFFVAPVIAWVIVEKFRQPLPDEPMQHPANVTLRNIWPLIVRRLRRIIPVSFRTGLYAIGLGAALIIVVLPYWLYSKADPITQVPIPHASRDSFLENTSAGIVFWLIPYGMSLMILPYAFYKGLSTRAWPLALSLAMLVLLGTGGTTPLPKLILRNSFNVLTLDRFTFWAAISMTPLVGEFVVSLLHGGISRYIRGQFGFATWRLLLIVLTIAYLGTSVYIANFTQFRSFQPAPINMQPIINFLGKDQHSRWRYIPLGFGDQMAWLSALTDATTVDGNYHSARRLPEMVTTSVERLEGAKFRGVPGIGSLQQFLAVPEKYNLKFAFSNDQFYDPLLYFSGWHRLQRLENGIMVWEREDIPPLPEILPRKEIPIYQRIMWGTVPMSAIFMAFFSMSLGSWWRYMLRLLTFLGAVRCVLRVWRSRLWKPFRVLAAFVKQKLSQVDQLLLRWSQLPPGEQESVTPARWQLWSDWFVRFKRLKPAAPTIQQLRSLLLCIVVISALGGGLLWFRQEEKSPVRVVQQYYDDVDFRRYDGAYARLDPLTRPDFSQYLLQLSVINGLVASYGKLNTVTVEIVQQEPARVVVKAHTTWMTSLSLYPTVQVLELVKRGSNWYIKLPESDITNPPDKFVRRGSVEWFSQGRSRVTTGTTSYGDILDRPVIQILSARLVEVDHRYRVVGELINTDVNPADLTVTALLYDKDGTELTSYNAQYAIIHKIFPKEVTPFRVDFEGVAGAVLGTADTTDFTPGAATPLRLKEAVTSFEVYAKAVVTGRDLLRGLEAQDVTLSQTASGEAHLSGQLFNSDTVEATIPHMLVTYYDKHNRVVWVDDFFIEEAVRSQRASSFDVTLTPFKNVRTIFDKGNVYSNILQSKFSVNVASTQWLERTKFPPGLGYSSFRISLHYMVGVA